MITLSGLLRAGAMLAFVALLFIIAATQSLDLEDRGAHMAAFGVWIFMTAVLVLGAMGTLRRND